MTRIDQPNMFSAPLREVSPRTAPAAAVEPRAHSVDVQATIDVIRREMVRSADMLSELAGSLTEELLGLMQLGSDPAVNVLVGRMSQILQVEDRIQQRLQDICVALSLLQDAMEADGEIPMDRLASLIAQRLMLGEMRIAFAGLDGAGPADDPASPPGAQPGEIDLF